MNLDDSLTKKCIYQEVVKDKLNDNYKNEIYDKLSLLAV